ncbi:hypothetical protein CRE_14504 [Caenorhabditis remanei]|uniref:Uncharacterized protein n=1 Tax=Caenorhabditis remanei TaxID=31234 RepID=E3M991_CAERE|nr:hypothetical protein CRE_14504 [Caenorhabditis remanei]
MESQKPQKRTGVILMVKKYCHELRERFEELGGERWPLEIIGVMRENGVETVEELRELCEKGVEMVPGGIVENANKAQDELALLQDAWNEERETLFREFNKLKEEKRLAEEAVSKYKKTIKEEREASSELRGLLRKEEGEPKKAGQARDTKEVPVPSRLEVVRKWSSRDSDDEFSMHGRRGEFSDSERSWGEDWKSGRSSRYSAGNEVMMGMVASMGRMMKASALPEPKTFDGTGDFKEFKRAFLLKYQQVTDEDDELVAILEERYLKGAAKSLFKSLGDRQERPIAELFVEFERKLRKRQGDAKAEALHEFDRLQKAPGQKLWEYLVEVEKWSKKAYPEVSKMRVRGQIKIPMVVRGRKVRVVFQLVDNWVEKILIGTNAFESIGVELKWKDPYGLVNDEENSAEVQFIGGEKKLERPGEKLRKVPTEVSEIQCKSVAVRGERGRSASTGDVGEVFKSEGEKERKKEAVVLVDYTDKEDENSKRVEFVKSVAKEVEKVWMMPRSLQCEFGDVDNVAKQWKEWLKTSANVEVVDPLMPVGNHKTPLILEKWHRKSLDGLQKYLHNALPSHPVRCQLEKNADRRPQSGLKKDLGKGCPIAERRGKWLRRSSTFSKPHGITEAKGNEYSRGNRKT